MGDVEVDLELVLAALRVEDAAVLVEALEEQLATRDVAWNEVAVAGVLVLEEVVAFLLGHFAASPTFGRVLRHPHAASLSAHALRDESEFVRARDRRRVHLNELAVRVASALLVRLARGGACVDNAVRRLAEDDARPTRREADGVTAEGLDRHRLEV